MAAPTSASAPASHGLPCWIIDAGMEPDPLVAAIRDHHLQPQAVLLTHAHLDHIAGLEELREFWPELPILIHPAEAEFLTEPELNLSIMIDEPIVAPRATGFLNAGDHVTLAGLQFEVRHTPGHSPGGITLYQPQERIAFVGDALFQGSIGRTDFPTSDHELLIRSIHEQLLTLPDHTRIFPGHGPPTTIGAERRGNPFLQ
jgi:hydroxyacylglutathione hydrolase